MDEGAELAEATRNQAGVPTPTDDPAARDPNRIDLDDPSTYPRSDEESDYLGADALDNRDDTAKQVSHNSCSEGEKQMIEEALDAAGEESGSGDDDDTYHD